MLYTLFIKRQNHNITALARLFLMFASNYTVVSSFLPDFRHCRSFFFFSPVFSRLFPQSCLTYVAGSILRRAEWQQLQLDSVEEVYKLHSSLVNNNNNNDSNNGKKSLKTGLPFEASRKVSFVQKLCVISNNLNLMENPSLPPMMLFWNKPG